MTTQTAERLTTINRQEKASLIWAIADILFARSGATVGKTYLFNEDYDACFAGYLIKATCTKDILL